MSAFWLSPLQKVTSFMDMDIRPTRFFWLTLFWKVWPKICSISKFQLQIQNSSCFPKPWKKSKPQGGPKGSFNFRGTGKQEDIRFWTWNFEIKQILGQTFQHWVIKKNRPMYVHYGTNNEISCAKCPQPSLLWNYAVILWTFFVT